MESLIAEIDIWTRIWGNRAVSAASAATKMAAILAGYLILRFVVFRIVARGVSRAISKLKGDALPARKAAIGAVQTALRSVAGFVLGFVAVLMMLQAVGIRVETLLATAGVAGVAVGFGAQKLVRDMISGFFILAEDQYGIGDFVTIGGASGTVEELGMRTTRIREKTGRLVILSNGDIAQVINHSRGRLRISVDIPLSAGADMDKAIRALNEAGESAFEESPTLVIEPFMYQGLSQLTAAAGTARIAGAVDPLRQDEAIGKVLEKVRSRLAESGVALG